MAYTLHQELTDATLEPAYFTLTNKAKAIRAAKRAAKDSMFDVFAIVVCDAEGVAIATFPTGHKML